MRGIPPVPKKRAVPERVAVKMALLRIRKIQHLVQDWGLPSVPVEGNRASIAEYLERLRKHTRVGQRTRKEMMMVLYREGMTDDALAEALRIAQIEEVMNS